MLQTEIHTTNQPALKSGAFQIKMALEKLRTYKSPGMDQILAPNDSVRSIRVGSEFHKLRDRMGNKNELPQQTQESITVPEEG
jgi:hypothetical protein